MRRRARSDGLHLTRVGLWFLVFGVVVAVAAANTGNNGLYLVLALMGGLLIVSHVMSRINVGALAIDLEPPAEIFANRPVHLRLEVRNRGRLLPRWWLLAAVEPEDLEAGADPERRRCAPVLVPRLAAGAGKSAYLELLLRRRGRRTVRTVHIESLFPIGLFRKGMRYPLERELLVYPEIFEGSPARPEGTAKSGEEPTRRVGWGHELFALRPYRHGDDPRLIHWKQSARSHELIFTEHETEENRRLSILLDNATGELDQAGSQRFERLVSEAATAALDALGEGYEVELATRDTRVDFAGGARQRRRILETLALVESRPRSAAPLELPGRRSSCLRLAMDVSREVAA